MKKIYSFVLMAAMLLIGTSAWAAIDSQENLQNAINALRGTSGTITLDGDITLTSPIYVDAANGAENGAAPSVILDLNGKTISMASADANTTVYMFVVAKGTLEIRNGYILQTGKTFKDSNVFTVYGTYNKTANYSSLIIGADVEVSAKNGSIIAVLEKCVKNGVYKGAYGVIYPNPAVAGFATDYPGDQYGFAFGVKVDVKGTLTVEGEPTKTYGIKTNGLLKRPKDGMTKRNFSASNQYEAWMQNVTIDASYDEFVPYVHVWPTAKIFTDKTIKESSPIYASGYAKWLVEGVCKGNIGAYISSGEVVFNDADVASNSSRDYEAPTGDNSVSGSGTGIVVNSRNQNAGDINVQIAGETKIGATSGYAIQEVVSTTNHENKVDAVAIESAEITGGGEGALIVTSVTKTTVYDATIDGDVKVTEATSGVTTNVSTTTNLGGLIKGSTGSETADKDFVLDVNTSGSTPVITVKPNTSKTIILNAFGYASFSAKDKTRAIKAADTDLKAYKFGSFENDVLTLESIEGGVIPQNTGVIFKGTAGKTYSLDTHDDVEAIENALKPAAAWVNASPVDGFFVAEQSKDNVYVLSGELLYKYEGNKMKENKAYLELGGNAAPARIRMVIAETQDIENVEVEAIKAVKFIENGQVLIKRGETIYNVQGQIVK